MKQPLRWPGWLPTIAAVLGLLLTLSAARWQFGRAAYKEQLAADYAARQRASVVHLGTTDEPADIRFRRVEATGEFLSAHTIYLDNRVRDGVAGFEVVTPLKSANGGEAVLVNRGWIARGPHRSELPAVVTPRGPVTVIGTAVVPPEHVYELSTATVEGRIWENLVLSRYRRAFRLEVRDFVIEQQNDLGDRLLRQWTAPGFGIERHKSYAAQWLIFAALIAFFYVYHGFIRRKNRSPQ